jgi:NAD-dependent deacetylase
MTDSPQSGMDIPTSLLDAIRSARHLMVFTGAGVSAESGIPTFRDPLTGLWERFDAGDLACPEAFRKDRALVWGWYEWRRMKVLRAQPNAAHIAIAELEKQVPKFTLVTQNVDDLHERAGSTDVIHLHGRLDQPRCFGCNRPHTLPPGIPDEPEDGRRLDPPKCTHCGGHIRPGVVWFGEQLPEAAIKRAFEAANECDLLFVVGTSGVVMPAAEIPRRAKRAGAKVVEVNPVPSLIMTDCVLMGIAATMMPKLVCQN